MFTLPCELFWPLGLPPYTPRTLFTLVAAWVAAWVLCLLLATQIISDISEWGSWIASLLILAYGWTFRHDMVLQQADMAMLAAMPAEVERLVNLLPDGLESLRQEVTTCGASSAATLALALRAQDESYRNIDRLLRALRWLWGWGRL